MYTADSFDNRLVRNEQCTHLATEINQRGDNNLQYHLQVSLARVWELS